MKKGQGKSLKYVPLANPEKPGEILLPGRHACNCEATKHRLINNCLSCGRIVCEQERSGPCYTCGQLVCSPREQEQISRMSKAGVALYNKLMNQSNETSSKPVNAKNQNLQSALQHRDKLLEYDKTAEIRTKVIDDQSDYFQTDSSWLSAKERELLKKKEEEVYEKMHGRKKNTLTFDLGQKKIIEEKTVVDFNVDELLKSDTSIFQREEETRDIALPKPIYEANETERKSQPSIPVDKLREIRIQDRELQEMSDEGWCLSVHQPYASLITAGIKNHEGRVWYTSYRGRLWIHSAGKIASAKEIADIQQFYHVQSGVTKFPETYPTGCLLGCVDLVECLPQEEYKKRYPHGEIASPYVFICENAYQLTFKFPMQGKHKLFKLDANVHQAAKKALRKLM